jgi:hypothetical protein
MGSFGGLALRFIAVICCASTLLVAIVLAKSSGAETIVEERTMSGSNVELVAEIHCGSGCTIFLSPADQKAIAAGGAAATIGITTRACGPSLACNAVAAAGVAMITMYVSEYGSDTCDMVIRIRNMGVGTTAVIVDHVTLCGRPLPV